MPAILAVGTFILTRFVLMFRYGEFVTDVPIYHGAAQMAMRDGLAAYCDFWFPYPPLSLPLIYFPVVAGYDYDRYRACFRWEMLVFDVVCFWLLNRFLRDRIRATPWRRAGALALYAWLGLTVGHLIYDRLDIVMSGLFLASIYFYTGPRLSHRLLCYASLLAGALVKLLPIFFLPLFMILEMFRDGDRDWPSLKRALIPVWTVIVPFALALLWYNRWICANMLSRLAEHGVRGIQIESTWAMPLIFKRAAFGYPAEVDYNFGAFHFTVGVPNWYSVLAKNGGMILLAAFFVALAVRFKKSLIVTQRLTSVEMTYLLYSVILILMSTQRVLSPQYFIWMMPLVAVQFVVARDRRAVVVGAAAVFGLTYAVFDKGFFEVLRFNLFFAILLSLRNILLIFWTLDVIRLLWRGLRSHRRTELAQV